MRPPRVASRRPRHVRECDVQAVQSLTISLGKVGTRSSMTGPSPERMPTRMNANQCDWDRCSLELHAFESWRIMIEAASHA